MKKYFLNLNKQSNGDNEVHEDGCPYFPRSNYKDLGEFSSCKSAVSKAKEFYPALLINGCMHCSPSCHTT